MGAGKIFSEEFSLSHADEDGLFTPHVFLCHVYVAFEDKAHVLDEFLFKVNVISFL